MTREHWTLLRAYVLVQAKHWFALDRDEERAGRSNEPALRAAVELMTVHREMRRIEHRLAKRRERARAARRRKAARS